MIRFEPGKRLVEKARRYIGDLELFLGDGDRAIPILLRALKIGDQGLKREITLLLGGFARQQIAWPLYRIIKDRAEDEDLRHEAAIQLSVTFPGVKEPQALIDRLLEDLRSADAELRSNAALALGWEGNHQVVPALIELLYDPEESVQQAAVNALSNLREERVWSRMLERLEQGGREQKRSILFNLWRFHSKRDEVAAVYKRYVGAEDNGLRFDALVLLGTVTEVRKQIATYRQCLQDRDPRLRELALKKLAELDTADLQGLKAVIESMLADPEMKVKQAAVRALRKIR